MTQVAIVGAGPYGLSIAAHLRSLGISYRIFGTPLDTWRRHMPAGMALKSDGFASNLSDPDERLRLAHWCQLNNLRKQALEEVSAAVQLEAAKDELDLLRIQRDGKVAELMEAEAMVNKARNALERITKLREQSAASREVVDEARVTQVAVVAERRAIGELKIVNAVLERDLTGEK